MSSRLCAEHGVPFVARGSGTGLSGGAVPHSEGVLIVMSRMRRVLEVDPVARRAVVEPGVTNLSVTEAVRPYGLFYAPDPSSQVVCSVGGNVAENSGGAHCLKHGFTVNHVLGLEIVTPSGELTWLGDGTGVVSGYDLLGAFTGSEGTLGIVTKIIVKLTPAPEAVHLVLAAYDSLEAGGRAVSDIIGAGIVPAAIEMMDALSIEAAEAAVHCGYPEGAAAVLLVELDGPAAEVEAELATVHSLCEKAGAREIRAADDPVERAGIWAGRKSAFAAVGRLSPAYIVQDGVVPRTALGDVLARICGAVGRRPGSGWRTCSTPGTATCTRWCCTTTPPRRDGGAPRWCPARSSTRASSTAGRSPASTASGIDKSQYMPKMFSRRRPGHDAAGPVRLRPGERCATRARSSRPRGCAARSRARAAVPTLPRLRAWRSFNAFIRNVRGRLRSQGACRGVRGRALTALLRDAIDGDAGVVPAFVALPASTDEAAAVLRVAAEHELAVVPRGGGSRLGWGAPPSRCDLLVDMSRMDAVLEHAAGDLVARLQAGARMGDVAAALAAGRAGDRARRAGRRDGRRRGGVRARRAAAAALRDAARPADRDHDRAGGRHRGASPAGRSSRTSPATTSASCYAGSAGTLGLITEATFRLHPLPAARAFVTAEYVASAVRSRATRSRRRRTRRSSPPRWS